MKIFDVMLDCGIHSRLDRTNGKLDALIEGQKGVNETLQEIHEKVKARYPNGVAQA